MSTPEHVHFAGYRHPHSPQVNLTYLQWRQDMGFRLGTTRMWSETGRLRPVSGVALRASQERADAAWVLGAHATEAEARTEETVMSLRYRLPTLPFKARMGKSENGVVANQSLIDRVFAAVDTQTHGRRLLVDRGPPVRPTASRPSHLRGAPQERDDHPLR